MAFFDKAATHCEEMVGNFVDGITSLIKSMIIALLDIFIRAPIMAIYLPIVATGDAIVDGRED